MSVIHNNVVSVKHVGSVFRERNGTEWDPVFRLEWEWEYNVKNGLGMGMGIRITFPLTSNVDL